jgi:mono/diheme cytochrome c family protein
MCRFRCEPPARLLDWLSVRVAWAAIVVTVTVCGAAGCVQQMADQPRYKPLAASSVFPNDAASRTPVPGTVARGELELDDAFFTGKSNGQLVTDLPPRALKGRTMAELLSRGQERFNIFCSQCHGEVGGGSGGSAEMRENVGMVVRRGFPMPPTYHQPRLRDAPIGHFFDVITNGLGRMPAHGYLVPPEDRWAIAAYIRALQFSQHAEGSELDSVDLARLNDERPVQQD